MLIGDIICDGISAGFALQFYYHLFPLGLDKDPLLRLSAGRWSSRWKELPVFTGEESPAVLRSVESLQNHTEAL